MSMVGNLVMITAAVVLWTAIGLESGVDDGRWLQQLYTATGGGGWNDTDGRWGSCNSGWNMTTGANPCNGSTSLWSRVNCSSNGRVNYVNLGYCDLRGTLPELDSSGGAMSQLQYMWLLSNKINGPLPASWSNLSRLQELSLNGNQLSGPLPPSWGNFSSLQQMNLHYNQLSGPLPASWSSLFSLQKADLRSNQLALTLPASWGSLRALVNLSLSRNYLSGSLPSSWASDGMLISLSAVDLIFNCLNLSSAQSNATQWSWWLPKTSFGERLLFQRSSCNCGVGQISTLSGYWCEDCPAGFYCPDNSTSVPCPVGTYNSLTGKSNASDACLACPDAMKSILTGQNSSRSCLSRTSTRTASMSFVLRLQSVGSFSGTTTGASICTVVSAAALFIGADLSVLDMSTFAAVQSVRCNDVLRQAASLESLSSSNSSPLKYLLSPFADFGPSVSSLGNAGLIVVVAFVHSVALCMLHRKTMHSWKRCTAHLFYPAISFTAASLLMPGVVRGAIVGVASSDSSSSNDSSSVVLGAVACVVGVAATVVMAFLWKYAVQRWCSGGQGNGKGLLLYRCDPMSWVREVKKKTVRQPLLITAVRLLLPHGHWTPTSTQRCIGIVFANVAGLQHRWLPGGLLAISLATVAISAAPASMEDVDGCTALHAVLSVLSSIPAVVIVLRCGPYRMKPMNGFTVLNSMLTAVTALITAVGLQHLSYADTVVRVIDATATALYISSVVRGVYLTGLRIAARVYAPPGNPMSDFVGGGVEEEMLFGGGVGHQQHAVTLSLTVMSALEQLITLACSSATTSTTPPSRK